MAAIAAQWHSILCKSEEQLVRDNSCALVPVGVQELSRLGVLSWFRIHETCGSKAKIDINAVLSFGNSVLTRSETVLAGVRRLNWQG